MAIRLKQAPRKQIVCFLLTIVVSCSLGCDPASTNKVHGTSWLREKLVKLAGWWKNDESDICRFSPKKDSGGKQSVSFGTAMNRCIRSGVSEMGTVLTRAGLRLSFGRRGRR